MPQTLRQWEDSLRQPALCELLPVRDYLDGCIIRTNGCFVAGYEVTDGHGDLTERYVKEQRIENAVLQALDRERLQLWNTRQNEGHYLRRRLHVYFIWNQECLVPLLADVLGNIERTIESRHCALGISLRPRSL